MTKPTNLTASKNLKLQNLDSSKKDLNKGISFSDDIFNEADFEDCTGVSLATPPRKNITTSKKTKKKKVAKKPSPTPTFIRKYNYSPYTISGKMKPKTLQNQKEPEGVHNCLECPVVFNKSAALKSHMARIHNPNLTTKCPECPKMLSSHSAIKKHLLSHRPKSEWPFECPLCGQKFQAKGDLPKHFHTSVHKNDKRVPEFGTPAWFQIIDQSCVNPDFLTTPKSKRRCNK